MEFLFFPCKLKFKWYFICPIITKNMKEWILVFLNYFLGFQRMRVLENTLKNSYGEDTPPVLFVKALINSIFPFTRKLKAELSFYNKKASVK